MKKVLVAMSGGIDSSVAAAILKQQGYQVIGVFMNFWHDDSYPHVGDPSKYPQNLCCSTESLEDARRIAQFLDISFYTLNVKSDFKKKVVDPFLKAYKDGLTPNPCIFCNKEIKFGYLFQKMLELHADYLATGHYSRILKRNNIYGLYQAKDLDKDQSYFLYTLKEKQLQKILFPVGNYEKTEVRKLAKKFKLPVKKRPESQEVCFIPDKKTGDFLKRHIAKSFKPGKIVNVNGKEYEEQHKGLPYYTIGQRRGIEIGGAEGPLYVVGFDRKNNVLIVGSRQALTTHDFTAHQLSFVNINKGLQPLAKDKIIMVRIRHQAPLISAKIELKKDQAYIETKKPVRAVTPGQSVVFYSGKKVVGGGIIA